MSAAAHYLAGMQMWEGRAKSLQSLVDSQDAEIGALRARLAEYEPEASSTEAEPDAKADELGGTEDGE